MSTVKTKKRIIRHGKVKLQKMYCRFCGCIFNAKPGEIFEEWSSFCNEGFVDVAICPDCGKKACKKEIVGQQALMGMIGL